MLEKRTGATRDEQRGLETREQPGYVESPFRVLQRFADQMDRVFEDFGFGRGWPATGFGRRLSSQAWQRFDTQWQMWSPDVEVFHRNAELVIRIDLPGLTREDVKVDVTDDRITIEGERHREHREEHEGAYRSERSYGSFRRIISLPEGVIADQAKGTFKDGVLEITMPAPPEQARRGRRLEVGEGASTKR